MNTLELLRKIHDAIGNSYFDLSLVPPKLQVLIPELRAEIRRRERNQDVRDWSPDGPHSLEEYLKLTDEQKLALFKKEKEL